MKLNLTFALLLLPSLGASLLGFSVAEAATGLRHPHLGANSNKN